MDEKELKDQKSKNIKDQKQKEKAKKKSAKKEQKKLNKILSMPYKAALNLALLFMVLGFIVFYFGSEFDIVESSYRAFLIFTGIYVGAGLLIVLFFYTKNKNKEMQEQRQEESLRDSEDIDDDEIERIIGESEKDKQ